MTNFQDPNSIGLQEPFLYRLQSCFYSCWWNFRDTVRNLSLQGQNIFVYPGSELEKYFFLMWGGEFWWRILQSFLASPFASSSLYLGTFILRL